MTQQARDRKRSGAHGAGGSAVKGRDTYALVTSRIIEQLEQGVVPWRKPWSGGMLPQNLASGHEYRGINVFVLGCCAPYASPYWLTFRQARELGGSVQKGEKGWPIVFWSWKERQQSDGTVERYGFLRRYTVFNAEAQCEGIDTPEVCAEDPCWDSIEAAEQIVRGYQGGPRMQHNGFGAAYNPAADTVQMPQRRCFDTPADYFSTLFHELGHSTGHESRLARPGLTNPASFGSHAYSKEELVAEMTAAFLCGEAGIVQDTLENSAAYIATWLERLRNDKRLVVQAAAKAQKGADLILRRAIGDDRREPHD